LFRARIPALISYTRGPVDLPFDRRSAAIDEVRRSWNDEKVKELLGSFLFGAADDVPQPLHQLMTVSSVSCIGKIAWIPFHMIHVLESIAGAHAVGHSVRQVVQTIRNMFYGFETGKTSGGDSWEALFVLL
jgi:hypothetical protein